MTLPDYPSHCRAAFDPEGNGDVHRCHLAPAAHWRAPDDSDGQHRCACGRGWVQRTIDP